MFMAPANMALRAEAHVSDRQYKQREMCFSLQTTSGQSDQPWAVSSVSEKRHHRVKDVLLLQNLQCLLAADLPSSGTFVLTRLVRGEDTLPQTLLRGQFSCHSCWQLCLYEVNSLWMVTGGRCAVPADATPKSAVRGGRMVLCQGLGGCGKEYVASTVLILGIV